MDEANDALIARLRNAMRTAVEEDFNANSNKQPATAKLKLLPEVVQVLQRYGP